MNIQNDIEIKRWNKPKRHLDLGIYPMNSSSSFSSKHDHHLSSTFSCVSAITFDDSTQTQAGPLVIPDESIKGTTVEVSPKQDDSIIEDQPNIKALSTCPPKHCDYEEYGGNNLHSKTRELKTQTTEQKDFTHCNAGSLISRITTGYIEHFNSEEHKEISLSVSDSIKSEAMSKNELSSKITLVETSNNVKYDKANMIKEGEDMNHCIYTFSNDVRDGHSSDSNVEESIGLDSTFMSPIANNNDDHSLDQSNDQDSDQWRQVIDHGSGKTYYYNRRTRKSTWKLPPNAILLKKKRNIHRNTKGQIIESSESNYMRDVSMISDSVMSIFTAASDENVNHRDVIKVNKNEKSNTCFELTKMQQDPWHSASSSPKSETITTEKDICIHTPDELNHIDDKKPRGIHCIFCGLKVINFIHHINNACCPSNCSQPHETYEILQNTLDTLKNYNYNHSCDQFDHDDKENIRPQEMQMKNASTDEIMSKTSYVNEIDDEDMIMDASINQSFRDSALSLSNVSHLVSTCPFCLKSFHGNLLSKHLLKCHSRKNSNTKRLCRNSVKISPLSKQKSNTTKIQTLITGGGRHLPGYPKLER